MCDREEKDKDKDEDENEDKDNDFVIPLPILAAVVGVSASILLAGAVSLLILCYRKRRDKKKARRPGQVDQNPVYGHYEDYYMGREWIELEDTSPYYGVREDGWEDFVSDNNPHYE